MGEDLVVYGSYGYTGSLIAAAAAERGLDPILAGRDRDAVTDQGIKLGCESEVVALDEPRVLDLLLEDAAAVVHCAGPFAETARPMIEACLRTGTHYVDVTGEIDVFEACHRRDEEFREAGIVCLPGAGFDVVPTDCLAARLADRVDEPVALELAFDAVLGASPGTAKTVLYHLDAGGRVRRDGRIVPRPPVHRTRTVDFGWDRGEAHVGAIPWGDVATAHYTTGVPDVTTYAAMSPWAARAQALAGRFGGLLTAGPVRSVLEALIDRTVEGPSAAERAENHSYVWGEVGGADGETVRSLLRCPHTYTTTADAAVGIADRLLETPPEPGYRTPAGAFGSDLILEVTDAEFADPPAHGDVRPA